MGLNIYKWLYTNLTPWIKRPWTFAIRDLWHRCEFVWIILLKATCVCLGHNFDWLTVLVVMCIFNIGFIFGHLFWGRKYIPLQGTEDEGDWDE